jgi:hypothetical protein
MHGVEKIAHGQKKHDAQPDRETDKVDVPFPPRIHRPAPQTLHEEKRHAAAIEGRERKEVEQPDEDAEGRRNIEEPLSPGMRGLSQNAKDGHRAVHLSQ